MVPFRHQLYESELSRLYRSETVDAAEDSAALIYACFREYVDREDYLGADVACSFLEFGYRQARRNFEIHLHDIPCDIESTLQIASVFKSRWDKARMDPYFLSLRQSVLEESSDVEAFHLFGTMNNSLPFFMDPFLLLKQDHKKVSDLFQEIESSSNKKKRKDLFRELKNELLVHSEIEEKYFYPVLEQKEEDVEMEEHAIDEHAHVKERLEKIESIESDHDEWMNELKKLREDVEHHVEEEESEIFSEIRDILNEKQLEDLAKNMKEEKEKRLREMNRK